MATPQFRNVDSPDFGQAFRGFQIGQGLIGSAFSGLDSVLAGVQGNRDRTNDNIVLRNALAQTDPDQLRAGLSSGSIYGGADPGRISAEVLQTLGRRTSELQSQRANDQQFNQNQFTNERTQSQAAAEDAAAPVYARLLAAQARGDTAGARKIAADNAGVLSALSFDRQGAASTALQNAETGALNRETGRFNLGQAREAAADTRASNAALNQAVINSVDPQSALQEYTRVSRDLGANAAAQFRQGLEGRFPGLFGPNGTAPGAGAPAGALSTLTGGASLPDSIRTVGDIVSNKSAVLNANPKGTATGLYQITSDTWKQFGPKALGADWQNADIRDPQVQDKVGEAIWDSAKGSAKSITNRWASISPSKAADLVGKPWSEVRDIVSQGETSTNASNFLRDNVPAGSNIAQSLIESTQRRFTQDNIGNSAQQIAGLEGDQRSANEIATALRGEGGALAGRSQGAVLDILNGIGRDYGLNPAQVAQLVENNLSSRSIPSRIGGGVVNALSGGLLGRPLAQSADIDTNALRAAAEQVRSGGSLQQLASNRNLTDNLADVQSRQVAAQNAAAAYQLAAQRLRVDPSNPTLQKLAQDRLQALQRTQASAGVQNIRSGTDEQVNALLRAAQERRRLTPEDVILIEAQVPGDTTIPRPAPAGRGRGLNY